MSTKFVSPNDPQTRWDRVSRWGAYRYLIVMYELRRLLQSSTSGYKLYFFKNLTAKKPAKRGKQEMKDCVQIKKLCTRLLPTTRQLTVIDLKQKFQTIFIVVNKLVRWRKHTYGNVLYSVLFISSPSLNI